MRPIKAFTLAELLIASSIFLAVMVSIYTAFHTGTFGYRDIEENIRVSQTAKQILECINLDLKNSFYYSSKETKFTGNKNDISFLTLIDTFIRGEIFQNYAYLVFKLEGDTLTRLCRKGKEALNVESEIKPQELGSNIEELAFSYGTAASGDQPLDWKDAWSDEKKLPTAVKVKLTIKNRAKHEFSRIIYLPTVK
jgi:type II secretory pathway component PulJ